MTRDELNGQIFIGVVEDNNDPKRIGRCKVRVLNLFDDIPTEDLPWATPWKDLNGNSIILPDLGKVVSVVFDEGNPYKPEYIFAEHYNINLEKKLKSMSNSDYTSMRALLFDHKTQIYSNDSEGLKLDYKFNNINITKGEINLNLKDNFGHVNIGSEVSNQQAILGNHFLNWFDEFVDILLGNKNGPYTGNSGSPLIPNPQFISILNKYKELKEPKFLSHHVNIVDNEYVEKQDRVCDGQIGDAWKSTVKTNESVTRESIDFKSNDGNSTDNPSGQLSTYVDENGNSQGENNNSAPPVTPSSNPDVNKIIEAMQKKGYKILTRPFECNIVGIRRQYEGDKYSNAFKDDLYLFFKNEGGDNWQTYKFKISTMPGFYSTYEKTVTDKTGKEVTILSVDRTGKSPNVKQSKKMLSRGGMGILMEAQYLNLYEIGNYNGYPAMRTGDRGQKFYRDNSPGDTIKYTSKVNKATIAAMFIHRGFPGGLSVENWSEGCQVFSKESELNKFFDLCQEHKKRYGNRFHYTLMLERDL